MKVTFLEGFVPLTKTYTLNQDGTTTKDPYPLVKAVTSHEVTVNNLSGFHKALVSHAKKGHCLLKGSLSRPVEKESRKGLGLPEEPTSWLCLDLDGVTSVDTVEDFISLLPSEFHNVSYIVQYSASMGFKPGELNAHIIFLLAKPMAPKGQTAWVKYINLNVPEFKENLTLTEKRAELKYPIDRATTYNSKLIFISPPILRGGLKDPFKGERIQLVKKKAATLNFDFRVDYTKLELDEERARKEICTAMGIPYKKIKTKVYKDTVVQTGLEKGAITEVVSEEGPFVRINLNGGDSAAYFYMKENPEVVYNHKGESNFLMKDFDPDFYSQAIRVANAIKQENVDKPNGEGMVAMVVTVLDEDRWYQVVYDQNKEELIRLTPSKTQKILSDFLAHYDKPMPDDFPVWDLSFDFDSDTEIDFASQRINKFRRSEALRNPTPSRNMPKAIHKLLSHVLADDGEILDHFNNWLATIIKERTHLKTGWLLHGSQSTGKGTFFSHVIEPMFGEDHSLLLPASRFGAQFNMLFDSKVVAMIDEVEADHFRDEAGLYAFFKYLTGNDSIIIEGKGTNQYIANNFTHLLFASNKPYPIEIPLEDKRINVGNFQQTPLDAIVDTTALRQELLGETARYVGYLNNYKHDIERALTPLETEERTRLQHEGSDTLQSIANALISGDFTFFLDEWPSVEDANLVANIGTVFDSYAAAMRHIMQNLGSGRVHRDAVRVLFYYIGGRGAASDSTAKFSRLLVNRGLRLGKSRVEGFESPQKTISVPWNATKDDMKHYGTLSGEGKIVDIKSRRKQ